MISKEKLLERIKRESSRMQRHLLEIENNKLAIEKAKIMLREHYGVIV